jgi:hypothetical protein
MKQLDITVNWKALKARRKAARMRNKTMLTKDQEQKERRALVGSTTTSTYHSLANLDLSLSGGRFSPGGDVSGSEELVRYPRLPPGNPWSHDQVGLEPPTNYEIDAQEPVGTAQEIASSEVSFLYSDDAIAPSPPTNPLEEQGVNLGGGGAPIEAGASSSNLPKEDAAQEAGAAPSSLSSASDGVEPPAFPSLDEETKALLELLFSKNGKDAR